MGSAPTLLDEVDLPSDPAEELEGLSCGVDARYEPRATLGEGGMGEVLLCRDRRMGRDVAMKVVHRSRGDAPDLRARFLREARVQGRLEHPAIVPVYDLAQDAEGRTFFTMKRVRGQTLEVVIARLAAGERDACVEYTRHKLLADFARVCLAIDFAHARGVVHCDLKPSNVMLGDFGEVYVLDWGVAKIGEAEELPPPDASGERPTLREPSAPSHTGPGVVLGTPAYMAPEQLRGRAVDARTDVYALGAILYELLTLSSFHEREAGDREALEASAPPELVTIWQKATARHPAERFPTARALHDAVERFLSGDRDLAARRELLSAHLDAARELRRVEPQTVETRSRALAEIGRAIALDPNDREALGILVELLGQAPDVPPPEVVLELERAEDRARGHGVKRAVAFYSLPALLFLGPSAFMMGTRSVGYVMLCLAAFLLTALTAALCARYPKLTTRVPWVTVTSSFAIACTSVLCGVFVLLPTLAVGNTICHAVTGRRRQRPMIVAIGALAILVPVALELMGVGPNAHAFVDGAMVLSSEVFELRESTTTLFLVVANVGMLVFAARYVSQYRNALSRSELQHLSQLWQLRQLVPERVRSATSDAPPAAVAAPECPIGSPPP